MSGGSGQGGRNPNRNTPGKITCTNCRAGRVSDGKGGTKECLACEGKGYRIV